LENGLTSTLLRNGTEVARRAREQNPVNELGFLRSTKQRCCTSARIASFAALATRNYHALGGYLIVAPVAGLRPCGPSGSPAHANPGRAGVLGLYAFLTTSSVCTAFVRPTLSAIAAAICDFDNALP
jgi:hypothetical protein